ncbi:MAG: tetratricopeptide repeat protein, partial [Synechococcales bacterium]|nr:tetratricopeptide repeat protein [Synechococcales bacterium]
MSLDHEFDVFLAHHNGDKPLVRQIATQLKQRGLKPWIDEEQIAPGQPFQAEIQQAVPVVKTAAIILGENGVGQWQEWEILTFFSQCVEKGKTVIPVLLPGVDEVPENLPFLRQLRWVSFKIPDDATALGLLVWGITGKRPAEELKERSPSATKTETAQPSSFDADTYYNQAKAQYELKNYQAAIADYDQAIQLQPDDASAYYNRGFARYDLGNKQGAIADYDQAIQLQPNDALAYNNRGNARSALDDKQGAIADYDQA